MLYVVVRSSTPAVRVLRRLLGVYVIDVGHS